MIYGIGGNLITMAMIGSTGAEGAKVGSIWADEEVAEQGMLGQALVLYDDCLADSVRDQGLGKS